MTTSFANLKRSSGESLSKLTQELTKINNPSTTKSSDDDRFWKPEADKMGNGSATIRFLPAPAKMFDAVALSFPPRDRVGSEFALGLQWPLHSHAATVPDSVEWDPTRTRWSQSPSYHINTIYVQTMRTDQVNGDALNASKLIGV